MLDGRLIDPVASATLPHVDVIPFVPGRRPTDEARYPWLGSSDQVAFVNAGEGNRCYLLLRVHGTGELVVNGVPVEPLAFVDGELRPHPLGDDRPYVVVFDPDVDFAGVYDFANRFTRRFAVTVNDARTAIDVYDVSQFGSLYERVVERILVPDAERQGIELAFHPWYPVLAIGSYKAELYTRALVGDIVHKRHNLADPGWLVRVGLYLELLTCLGVFAAVDPSVLSEDEQRVAASWDDLDLDGRRLQRCRGGQPLPRP